MNEDDNFYNNASVIGSRLSSIQQREEEQRAEMLDFTGKKFDTIIGKDSREEQKDEGEGGAETGGGATASLLYAGVKKVVSGRVKDALRNVVQNKIDQVKQAKAQRQGQTDDDTPSQNLDANDPAKAPAPDDAPIRSQPELDIDGLSSAQDVRDASNNLKARVNNMDDQTKQNVQDNFDNDPEKIDNPSSLEDYQNNLGVMEGHVADAEKNPATKFTNEDTPTAPDDATAPDVQAPAQPPTQTTLQQQGTSTQNIQSDTSTADLDASSLQQPTGTTTIVQRGNPASNVQNSDTAGNIVDDAGNELADNVGNISQKGMDVLTDKLGVDFGDLAPADLGGELAGAVGEASGSMLGAIGGALGTALDFLGPIGMLVGLGTTIYGLSEDSKVQQDTDQKQDAMQKLAGQINDMGGMSYGSIASTPLDTTQFRSGGSSLNF